MIFKSFKYCALKLRFFYFFSIYCFDNVSVACEPDHFPQKCHDGVNVIFVLVNRNNNHNNQGKKINARKKVYLLHYHYQKVLKKIYWAHLDNENVWKFNYLWGKMSDIKVKVENEFH